MKKKSDIIFESLTFDHGPANQRNSHGFLLLQAFFIFSYLGVGKCEQYFGSTFVPFLIG